MKLMIVLLSAAAMLEISIFPGVIFLSQGKPSQYFKLMLFTKLVSMIGIVVGVVYAGILGMLVGMLITALINFLPYLILSTRIIKLDLVEQLRVNLLPFVLSATSAAVTFSTDLFLLDAQYPFVRLVCQAVIFLGVLSCLCLFFRPYPLENELSLLLSRRPTERTE